MDKSSPPMCEIHTEQRLARFCKNSDCWIKVCPQCANEGHKGHRIVEYETLTHEAMSVKENLIQVKKGDLLSLKRIMNNMAGLQSQLKEARERYREDKRVSELHILSRIENVAREEENKFKELDTLLAKFHKKLKETHNNQAQELDKIPELANAVVAEGTIDDLKTFFEMCQQGIESNTEILEYKKRADVLREDVEDFVMQNPFQFAFSFNRSLFEELKGESSGVRLSDLLGQSVEKAGAVTNPGSRAELKHTEHAASKGDLSRKNAVALQANFTKMKRGETNVAAKTSGSKKLSRGDSSRGKGGVASCKIARKASEQTRLQRTAPTLVRNLSASRKSLNAKCSRSSVRSPKAKCQGLRELKSEVAAVKAELKVISDTMREKVNSISCNSFMNTRS